MSTRKKSPKTTQHSLKGVARRVLDTELSQGHQGSDWRGELSPRHARVRR
jgi:ribonuclease D